MCSCNQRAVQVGSSYTPSYRRPMKKPTFIKSKIPVSQKSLTESVKVVQPKATKLEWSVKSTNQHPKMTLASPTKYPNIKRR